RARYGRNAFERIPMARSNPYQAIEHGAPGRIGWRIHYFEELDSTQTTARELANEGSAQGTVVIAERQTAGRGRMGRTWHSPAGANLYATFILRPAMPIAEVPRLSLVAGVAAAEALAREAPGLVALKWPNDVWLRGRKVGGIIAEAMTDLHGALEAVLLGIGLNLNLAPEDIPAELRDKATSLRAVLGRPCDRIAIAESLCSFLDYRYMEVVAQGFGAVRPVWEGFSALTGKRVTVVDGERREAGIVRGIDPDGALILDTGAELRRILAGDVSIEGAYE
ncbi:MAG TPA: biotin--[acetyl-CoA-carboxylase] ligase, partial [Candidatus Binataceae bacterium]|nr:biotin--[acetyl-CoA-carboxylase] ligase [Candidatus Binataceae bacterium]